MPRKNFYRMLEAEVARIDEAKTAKRRERTITSFSNPTTAVIGGRDTVIFNSNDYLGLRHNPSVIKAEHRGTDQYGTGPGAVRFISGSLKVHRDLEKAVAAFHGRDDAIVFSSAFAANLAVIFSLVKGQSKDSRLTGEALVVSDALNHRSIIDGIRLANLGKEQRAVFAHMDMESLRQVLEANLGKYPRVLVVTDGVFSMLGEYQKLDEMRSIVDEYDGRYPDGVMIVMDDAHGVASCGETGRGVEEVKNAKADVLIGTFGKGFGADGGYAVAGQGVIDYLRESAATYIYSNSVAPGTAAAALEAVRIVGGSEGEELLGTLRRNAGHFKKLVADAGLSFAAESEHAIQPVLVGDPARARALADFLFEKGFLVTNISYPVVPKGRDEIRIQINSSHGKKEIEALVGAMKSFMG